ncbi:MAG TPA: fimbria/pilus periplasmic chaperone [Gallionellaceae bacterium]
MFASSAFARLMMATALAGAIVGARAGSLTVTPVIVNLDSRTLGAALTVRNEGNEARVIQTELLRWTQKNGADVYTPSHDILVNPPIATLQPGQTQTVRIGLKREVDNVQELAYRLYLTEVPPPSDHFTGMRIALRLGVPVYVSPRSRSSTRLVWRAARTASGALLLTLLNEGNRHLRMDSFRVMDPGSGQALGALRSAPFTLLAGQARRYSLPLPAGWTGRQVKMLANTAEGLAETRVDVPGPVR